MTPIQFPRQLMPTIDAARAGVVLGLYFAVKYLCLMYGLYFPLLYLIFFIATLAVPFVAYRMTKGYGARLAQVGYMINFRMAWAHGTMLYFFASIILLLPQYMFFTRMYPEQIQMLQELLQARYAEMPGLEGTLHSLYGVDPIEVLRESLQIPIFNRLLSSLSNNVVVGAILSLINAAIISRKAKPQDHA